MADYVSEQFLKRQIGKTDVEDALLQLDFLTKEESLMAGAKNLEVAHRVNDRVEAIEWVTHSVDQTTKAVKERTQLFLSFVKVPTLFPILSQNRIG